MIIKRPVLFIQIAILSASLVLTAHAKGERGGNGGDVIVCANGVFMLDSIEAERRGFPLQISDGTIREKVTSLIERVNQVDQIFAEELKREAMIILADAESYALSGDPIQTNTAFVDGDLVNVADEGATYIPAGCEIKQLIIQNQRQLPGDKRYLIQAGLWNRMSTEEKSMGIVHESLFAYLLSREKSDSPGTRYLNGFIGSGEILRQALGDVHSLLGQLGFRGTYVNINGFLFYGRGVSIRTTTNQVTALSSGHYETGKIQHQGIPLINGLNYLQQEFQEVKLDSHREWVGFKTFDGSLSALKIIDWNRRTLTIPKSGHVDFPASISPAENRSWFYCSAIKNAGLNHSNIFTLANLKMDKVPGGYEMTVQRIRWENLPWKVFKTRVSHPPKDLSRDDVCVARRTPFVLKLDQNQNPI